jgi:hypothetical protein
MGKGRHEIAQEISLRANGGYRTAVIGRGTA